MPPADPRIAPLEAWLRANGAPALVPNRTALHAISSPFVGSTLLVGYMLRTLAHTVTRRGNVMLQVVPLLVITPLTFLGGAFYSINMLPEPWQTVSLFNPVVYLISGLRWAFYGAADVHIALSTGITLVFMAACLAVVWWVFKTGWRIRR